jgi:hypothetical protein
MPQLDTQNRIRDNPHRTGPENPWPRPISLRIYTETNFAVRDSLHPYSKSPSHQGGLSALRRNLGDRFGFDGKNGLFHLAYCPGILPF